MANRRQSRAHKEIITQADINHRLHRAEKLASNLYYKSIVDNDMLTQMLISAALSYIAEDLRDIQRIVNGKQIHT